MSLCTKKAHELHALLANKEITATELTKAHLERIQALDNRVKAFITVTEAEALACAAKVDQKVVAGEKLGPLAGIPISLKDNVCTEGILTTCASKMLHNYVPPYSATVARKLEAAGTVLLGKTNLDEFAMGTTTEHSVFFRTSNPWNLNCVPGGSSGGSTASVAAGEAVLSLGTDTGGSVRQPAAFCGVVGMKPTYGTVSRYGVVPLAASLDQVGPIARDVRDCAQLLNAISGHDPSDSTSATQDYPDYTSKLGRDIKGFRIGLPKEYFGEGVQPAVKDKLMKAVQLFESLGAQIEECSLPHTEYAQAAYYLIVTAECSSNMARYDGVRYGYRSENAPDVLTMYKKTRAEAFGEEVKRRILLGTYALSSGCYDDYYLKALKVRTLIRQDFDQVWHKYDLLLAPTTPSVAFKINCCADDLLKMYAADTCTLPANLAGIPALSINCGFVDNLPVGLQLVGKAFDEARLLQAAYAYEQASGMHRQMPELEV